MLFGKYMKHCIHQAIALAILSLAIGCGLASAHQDTPLQLKDGVLEGLPKVFQPARFDLEKKVLTIGGKNLELPPTLRRWFPDDHTADTFAEPQKGIPYDLSFSASWYHGLSSTLPPYLQIRITPKERDFCFEIIVDIQSLKILEANMIVSLSPNSKQRVPIAINSGKEKVVPTDLKWQSIIGTWRAGSVVAKISSDKIVVTDDGEAVEFPTGSISPIEPGVMSLRRRDGTMEKFRFNLSGDILELNFERGGFIGLAKQGSETDKLYERLEKEEFERAGAGQPATRPESKSEGGDKPQPEAEGRSR